MAAMLTSRLSLRSFGPLAPPQPATEALRAGFGAVVGLMVAALLSLSVSPDLWLGIYLIAPFGASAVLVFAAPNSPLAQPWPAVVGNTVSALVAIGVCRLVPDPVLRIPLAVGASIVAMALCRATHPPGGAVAMTVAMSIEKLESFGYGFAFLPVATGTILLVLIGIIYARLTGRHYPLRQFTDVNPSGTQDRVPAERLGLSESELSDILVSYRQSLNLGVEDLARLLAAAELQAASHRADVQRAQDIMSRDLVTVGPDARLKDVAALFVQHNFTSLPVVGADDQFLGVIFQLDLISRSHQQTLTGRFNFATAMGRLLSGERNRQPNAASVMRRNPPLARPDTPIAALLPQLASDGADAVPVLDGARIVGIVTRTDLIAALARQSLRAPA
jgi:CBS domain-containing membrane protein